MQCIKVLLYITKYKIYSKPVNLSLGYALTKTDETCPILNQVKT